MEYKGKRVFTFNKTAPTAGPTIVEKERTPSKRASHELRQETSVTSATTLIYTTELNTTPEQE